MSVKETVVVICPGRGTYNAAELGYLHTHHAAKVEFLNLVDTIRMTRGQVKVTELDAADKFRMGTHTTGENASLLIFACAVADYLDVQERYDVVAITGNSMGWYLALACAGALSMKDAAFLVNEMGTLMHEEGAGGQIVYPVVDDNWQPDEDRTELVRTVLAEAEAAQGLTVAVSIRLGGMVVFAADEAGLKFLKSRLPETDRYPMQLKNHAAFHSSLLDYIVPQAQSRLPQEMFHKPAVPLVDGCGNIWSPYATDTEKLYDYTLGTQINTTYDFSKAVEVAVKEFAPDRLVLTGPGTTMGAPVAQEMIRHRWRGIDSKVSFKALQEKSPYIISMGMPTQREIALRTPHT
ncbi:hypothetical protein [Parvularcula sp. IMCC14364]|uniref:hypothetical protein n=1 Tax=Parvularcula sp. IMCC14364 TaxID=3067902 RepID=UPI002740D0FC|nr:hypothetical protein [Parvularcula sp. IMCC14364]